MPCAICGAKAPMIRNTAQRLTVTGTVSQNCGYTAAMLQDFNVKLEWFKSRKLYAKYNILAKTINKYIGIVQSGLNINDICRFKDQLDIISDFVDFIVTIQNDNN
jgi:hypothetical protein